MDMCRREVKKQDCCSISEDTLDDDKSRYIVP